MDFLDILIEWINENDVNQFWFIENDVICCWPQGWVNPVAVFVIDGYIIKSLELGIVLKNNLKEKYSVYDPNFFQDLQHSLTVHKTLYSSVII